MDPPSWHFHHICLSKIRELANFLGCSWVTNDVRLPWLRSNWCVIVPTLTTYTKIMSTPLIGCCWVMGSPLHCYHTFVQVGAKLWKIEYWGEVVGHKCRGVAEMTFCVLVWGHTRYKAQRPLPQMCHFENVCLIWLVQIYDLLLSCITGRQKHIKFYKELVHLHQR